MKMLRVALVCLLGMACLVTGCKPGPQDKEKADKEEKTEKTETKREAVQAPEGMKVLRFMNPVTSRESVVFFDKSPVTNAEYRSFYEATHAAYPVNWPALSPDVNDATEPDDPVMLTDVEIARDFASWVGKRLPTPGEWSAATDIVGDAAWPYGGQQKTEFKLYLAREPATEVKPEAERHEEIKKKYMRHHQMALADALKKLTDVMEQVEKSGQGFDVGAVTKELDKHEELLASYTRLSGRHAGFEKLTAELNKLRAQKAAIIKAAADEAGEEKIAQARKAYEQALEKQIAGYTQEYEKFQAQQKDVREAVEKLKAQVKGVVAEGARVQVKQPELPQPPLPTDPARLKDLQESTQSALQAAERDLIELKRAKALSEKLGAPQKAIEEEMQQLAPKVQKLKALTEEERKSLVALSKNPYFKTEFEGEQKLFDAAQKLIDEAVELAVLQKKAHWLRGLLAK